MGETLCFNGRNNLFQLSEQLETAIAFYSHTETQSFTEVFILTQISQKPQKFFCLRSKGYKEKITSKHTKTSKMPLREYYLRLCVRKVI